MSDAALTPELMLHAYASGIFPMAEDHESDELFWVDPKRRGVFPLDQFHISRSLKRAMRRDGITATLNHDFAAVVHACADREETWINDTLHSLYQTLHEAGCAHSVEVWRDGTLAGGVFGLTLGTAFFGESMFSSQTNGSKMALAFLIDRLRTHGFTLFDTQFITDHLASLGAIEISRAGYLAQLSEAMSGDVADLSAGPMAGVYDVLQRTGQTS